MKQVDHLSEYEKIQWLLADLHGRLPRDQYKTIERLVLKNESKS